MDKFTKRGSNGEVDVAASATAYADALTAWSAENEIPSEKIAAAVNAVLDRHPGTISVPSLLSFAVQEMEATPETYGVLTKRVHAYVTGQKEAGLLFVTKGKGGGCSRTAPTKKGA